MKKTTELSEAEITQLRKQFKEKHKRSLFFDDGSYLSRVFDYLTFKSCIHRPQMQ